MILLELALQGVKGFPQSAKLALRPGYNVILGVEKTPMSRLIEALFYAEDNAGPTVDLIMAAGQPSRTGLTLQGKDGATYRLVGDFASGGRALFKLDPGTQKFAALSERPGEIGQYLRGQLGLPPKKMFADLFVTQASALPSRVGRPAAAPAKAAAEKPSFGGAQLRRQDLEDLSTDPTVLKAQLEKLQAELKVAQDFAAAQDRQAELQQEIATAEAGLADLRALESEEAEQRMELEKFAAAEGLPAGIEERIKRMGQFQQRRDDAMARIARDRETLEGLLETVPEPFWKDSRFWGSVAGGLAFFGGAVALGGSWRLLALADLIPFGGAAFFAYQYVHEAEERDGIARRLESLGEREKVVEREFENAMAPIQAAQKALGVHEPLLIVDLLQQRDDARAALEAKRREIETTRVTSPYKDRIEAQIKAREELKTADALIAAQGYTRDPSEVEREIERHEAALGSMVGQKLDNVDSLFEAKFVAGEGDKARELLTAACDLFVTKPDEIGKAVAARLNQYLTALTGRKFVSAAVDAAGTLTVTDPQARSIPFTALSPAERDEVWLSLKLTLLERYLGRHKLPLLFDDPFADFDDARRGLAAKMLKYLGSLSQVVQCAEHPAFASSADQAVRLG